MAVTTHDGKMHCIPNASDVEMFRNFAGKPMSLRQQLDPGYHDDKYLTDILMRAVKITSFQIALRDRVPRTDQ